MQTVEINGEQVEVYTVAEHTAAVDAAKAAVEGEWKPKVDGLNVKLTDAEKAAAKRAAEFGAARGEFNRLSEEQQAKMSATELTLYKNQELLAEKDKQLGESAKVAKENAVAAAIRAKVGTDQKLFEETLKMYGMIGLDDATSEGITARATAALGALGSTQPDLLATAGFANGAYLPPTPPGPASNSFADSDAGKAMAKELGLMTEAPKQ